MNIFLKDNYQGAELGFRYGTTVEGAVAERRGYLIAGLGNDTTQITVGAQYYEIDPLFQRQRDYSFPAINWTTTYGGVGRDNFGGGTTFYLLKGTDPSTYAIGLNSPFDAGIYGRINPAATGRVGHRKSRAVRTLMTGAAAMRTLQQPGRSPFF